MLSRRSRGISVGVNLNPDKICNFDCIYCQVDRTTAAETTFVETERLLDELESACDWFSPATFIKPKVPRHSGEPAAAQRHRLLRRRRADDVSQLRRDHRRLRRSEAAARARRRENGADHQRQHVPPPHVQRGLAILDANNGEIWAKLEAGTEEYYQLVERTPIPFRQILDNITAAAQVRPLVIQALFMRINGDAAAGGAGSLLRPAERDHGRRRPTQARADLHGRPPPGGIVRRAAGERRSRRHRGTRRSRTGLPTAGFYGVPAGTW